MYDLQIEVGNTTLKYTSRWLLNQLILNLGIHLDYKCIHKKFGIMLYWRNGDILTSLSWALGTGTDASTCASMYGHENSLHAIHDEGERKLILEQASFIVNDLIHNEILIKNSIQNKPIIEQNPRGLDIDHYISTVSPSLWQFLEHCTMSIRDRQHHQQSDHIKHIKKLRRFFILCQRFHSSCC